MSFPKIAVALSTYNGEKYIDSQLESIIKQKDVSVDIYIRDDGSTDKTVYKIKQWMKKYDNIFLKESSNIGYKRSFLSILLYIPEKYDYYAFSDQDDVWLSEKLYKACDVLDRNRCSLYVSALNYVNESLEFIKKRDYSDNDINIYKIFSRMRFAGCTMVFDYALFCKIKEILNVYIRQINISHDGLVMTTCAALDADIYLDHNSYIMYRRSPSTVTSGGTSFFKRIRFEYQYLLNQDNRDLLAKELLSLNYYTNNTYKFIYILANYKENFIQKLKLVFRTLLLRNNILINLESVLKIFINTF